MKSVVELANMAKLDCRLHYWLPDSASGVIGHRKRQAAMLSRGDLLAEMDHDDALLPHALAGVVASFAMDPRIGFVYTDFSEPVFGTNLTRFGNYGADFPLHFLTREYGREYLATRTRPLIERSLYHLACLPNHVRVWNATVYRQLNGHAPLIVGDDYELLMRTFLATRSMYYDRLAYLQYRNLPPANEPPPQAGAAADSRGKLPWDNFTFRRNRLIQWIVANVYQRYWPRLHERARALGPGNLHFQYGWTDELGNVTVVLPVMTPDEDIWPAVRALRQQTFTNWRLLVLTADFPCNETARHAPLPWTPVSEKQIDRFGRVRRVPSETEWIVPPSPPPPPEEVASEGALAATTTTRDRKPLHPMLANAAVERPQMRCLRIPAAATAAAGDNPRLALRERGTELATSHWIAHLSSQVAWHRDHLKQAVAALQPAGVLSVNRFKFIYSSVEACQPAAATLDHLVVGRALHWSPLWRDLSRDTDGLSKLLHHKQLAAMMAHAPQCLITSISEEESNGGRVVLSLSAAADDDGADNDLDSASVTAAAVDTDDFSGLQQPERQWWWDAGTAGRSTLAPFAAWAPGCADALGGPVAQHLCVWAWLNGAWTLTLLVATCCACGFARAIKRLLCCCSSRTNDHLINFNKARPDKIV